MEEQEKPFTLAEIMLGTFVALIVDGVAAAASLISVGVFGFFVHSISWLIFTLWFTIKGVGATSSLAKRYLIPIAAQAIPFLPTTTAAFLITTYIENNPEKLGVLETAVGIATKL